ncbi:MAG TPA: acyltransferase domain-containing protein [Pseudonocardiaceae bacterium]|jgi:acyl transferase domain-containing protein|nr:acyltransferase domain-containing protein [Pseudonocardiaceae bacterium]
MIIQPDGRPREDEVKRSWGPQTNRRTTDKGVLVFMNVRRDVALVFPGQGAQQPRMGAGLYGSEPEFTRVMDEFFAASGATGARLRDMWLSYRPGPDFDDCSLAQPLLFAVGVALALAVIARGIKPAVLVGHSVGELAAAAVAGVYGITDAGQILAARTTAMAGTRPGGMIAVATGVARVTELFGGDLAGHGLAIAAINSPRQTVLSGAADVLADAERTLLIAGVAVYRVKARQAFHSPLCDAASVRFGELIGSIGFRPPTIPIRSTATGRDVSDDEAVTPTFWANQLARTVLFGAAMDELFTAGNYVVLEAGPAGGVTSVLRKHRSVRSGANVLLPLLPTLSERNSLDVFEESLSAAFECVN